MHDTLRCLPQFRPEGLRPTASIIGCPPGHPHDSSRDAQASGLKCTIRRDVCRSSDPRACAQRLLLSGALRHPHDSSRDAQASGLKCTIRRDVCHSSDPRACAQRLSLSGALRHQHDSSRDAQAAGLKRTKRCDVCHSSDPRACAQRLLFRRFSDRGTSSPLHPLCLVQECE